MSDVDVEDAPAIGQNFQVLWEQQVLAGCMFDAPFAQDTAKQLSADKFCDAAHKMLFAGVQSLIEANDLVTPKTLADEASSLHGESSAWLSYLMALLEMLNLSSQGYQQAARNLAAPRA